MYLNSIMDLCLSFSATLLAYEDESHLENNKAALQEITKVKQFPKCICPQECRPSELFVLLLYEINYES